MPACAARSCRGRARSDADSRSINEGGPMRSNFETITVERHDNDILLVTLNRPEAANALNTQMGLDLMELFEGFSVDLEGIRVVIVTGAGAKAFCAGGDLKQRD